ncbi:MAG TPA: hypothetical protein VNJ04_08625 [Gemmatimonadaceae bacterium]|nr:hypothetical protein [Gemmatimonadaceae bacterium]
MSTGVNTITAAPIGTTTTPSPVSDRAREWAKKAVHRITLDSGMEVDVRLPDLAILIEGDALPDRLRGVAAQMWSEGSAAAVTKLDEDGKPQIDVEVVKGLAQLRRHMAAICLVDPAMTADELSSAGIPAEDIDLLASIAMRERDTDARGVKLGVMPLSRFDTWRQSHGCADDCEACNNVVSAFSTR